MSKSKSEKDHKEIEELAEKFRKISSEKLISYKSTPRGHSDKVFKKALNQELRLRGIEQKEGLAFNIDSLQNLSPDENEIYRLLDEALWYNWDPIGVNEIEEARDEYYDYLPGLFKLKTDNADEETIAEYLLNIETKTMGLFGNIENCRRVAIKIISLFK
jgi:hypothetical protein